MWVEPCCDWWKEAMEQYIAGGRYIYLKNIMVDGFAAPLRCHFCPNCGKQIVVRLTVCEDGSESQGRSS